MAPCNIKAATQRAQASLLGYVLSDSSQAVGLVLDPIFSHQKGQVYMAQHSARKMLAEQNLNLDNHFMLQFENKSDARDGRPNTYLGSWAFSLAQKDSPGKFRTSGLWRFGRSELASMLQAKDMLEWQEMEDDDPLPSGGGHASDACHQGPRGAKRCEPTIVYVALVQH